MMNIFAYKVLLYHYDEEERQTNYSRNCGLLVGDSWAEAANVLEEQFDNELDTILYLTQLDSTHVIGLPEEMVDKYMTTDFPDIDFETKANWKGENLE